MFPITFAIITDGKVDDRIERIIDSIEAQTIPEYEVLIVGGLVSTIDRRNTVHVSFDEATQPMGWITRKKNLATELAQYDNIVYLHDYHVFLPGWYPAVVAFDRPWDIQMHAIELIDGTRMLDWLTWDHPELPRYTPIPYDRHDLQPWQYISGGYWMASRNAMVLNPLDVQYMSHQGEDVEWSLRIRNRTIWVMNPHARVRHNKPHRELAHQPNRMAALEKYGFSA